MIKKSFLKKLFLPLALFLALVNLVSVQSIHLRNIFQTNALSKGVDYTGFFQNAELFSVAIFALLIWSVRKVNFRKIFYSTLLLVALLLIGSVLMGDTKISCFITGIFCSQLLLFIGWAYVNQIFNLSQGAKSYFALNFVVGLLLTPLSFIKMTELVTPISSWSPLFVSLVALGLIWACDRWIQSKLKDFKPDLSSVAPSGFAKTTLSLGLMISALNLAFFLISFSFKSGMVKNLVNVNDYAGMMGNYALMSGISILAFTLLSLWVGPKILQTQGWRKAFLIAPALGLLATLGVILKPVPIASLIDMSLLKSLQYAWIFPLIQIAFLTYPLRLRVFIQACVVLVFAPLFEVAVPFIMMLGIDSWVEPLLSLVILGLMGWCAWWIGKKNRSLSQPVKE